MKHIHAAIPTCSNKNFSFILYTPTKKKKKPLDLIECALPGKRKLRERSTRLRRAIAFNFSSRAIELRGIRWEAGGGGGGDVG